MKISKLEEDKNKEENIIKDVKNLFRLKKLKKETNDVAIKGIRNLFRLKKQNKAIKYRILRNIRNIFEHEQEDHYKSVRGGNFWSSNYIEYKSEGNRKTLNLAKTRPCLKNINNLKKSETCKIHLTITINFISSEDDNDE